MQSACDIIDDDEDDYENLSDMPAVPTREKKIDTTGKKGDLQLKSCSVFDDDDDDNDDYENASNLSKTPAVPAREKKIDTTGKKEGLQLKYLPKPVIISQNQDHLSMASGLDFSSLAVNAAFKDLPEEPSSKNNPGSGWMKIVLVMCLILIFLMAITIFSIMFIYYRKIIDGLQAEILTIKSSVGKKDSLEAEILTIKRFLDVSCDSAFEDDGAGARSAAPKDEASIKKEGEEREGLCISCPPEWTFLNFNCYYLSKFPKTWEASRKDCSQRNSTLLILKSRKELDALLTATANKRFWIGLRKVDKIWKWVDETDATFTNWNQGEPNNSGNQEHCTEMITGGWNDLDCSRAIDYICQRQPGC
ncbi:C-type lectin domain family 4 member G-like [Mantella aurantiaca]